MDTTKIKFDQIKSPDKKGVFSLPEVQTIKEKKLNNSSFIDLLINKRIKSITANNQK